MSGPTGSPAGASDPPDESPFAALVAHVIDHFEQQLEGRLLAVWGLALNPACRWAIDTLVGEGSRLVAYDPLLWHEQRRYLSELPFAFAVNRMSALNGADALLILTGWREFRCFDPRELRERMRTPLVFDSHNLHDKQVLAAQGVQYHSVARGSASSSLAGGRAATQRAPSDAAY